MNTKWNKNIEFANRYLREQYRGMEGKELTKATAIDKAKGVFVDRSNQY